MKILSTNTTKSCLTLMVLVSIAGCSSTTTTTTVKKTRVPVDEYSEDEQPRHHQHADEEKEETTTTVEESGAACSGILSCTVHGVGYVLALPFRLVGGIIDVIF